MKIELIKSLFTKGRMCKDVLQYTHLNTKRIKYMTKLPEPVELSSESDERRAVWGYTEEQMLQFRRDSLEEAANIAEDEPEELSGDGTYVCTPSCIARAIRKLGESL